MATSVGSSARRKPSGSKPLPSGPKRDPVPIREADSYRESGRGAKKEYTDYAWLAKSAYEGGKNESSIPSHYKVDAQLSNRNRTVFFDESTGEAVVSYRGTNPKNFGDLGTDLAIAVGAQGKTSRFKNAEAVAKQAVAKYGKEHVTLTGHSLGGTQALYVGNKLDLKAKAFNPGKGFDGLGLAKDYLGGAEGAIGARLKAQRNSKLTVYSTGTDPISTGALLDRTAKKKIVKAKSKNPLKAHDIENFL